MSLRLGLYAGVVRDSLRHGEYRALAREAARQLYSEHVSIVIGKDLSVERSGLGEHENGIRPASSQDLATLLGTEREEEVDASDLWERRLRQHIVASAGIEGCFVADAPDLGPAFMQYLFTADDNDRLQSVFPGLFPILAADEALVEFLYISLRARNPGLAIRSLVQVTEEAQRRGAKSVVSFIDPDNVGALFVNHLAGFKATAVRRRRRRLFRSRYTFEAWPDGASHALNDVASGKAAIS